MTFSNKGHFGNFVIIYYLGKNKSPGCSVSMWLLNALLDIKICDHNEAIEQS